MASAADQVFTILELAEPILLQVPMMQLFVLRRVSMSFLRIITGSVLLRRITYLDATPERDMGDEMLNEPYALGRFYHRLKLRHFSYNGIKYSQDRPGLVPDGWNVPTLFFKCDVKFEGGLAVPEAPHGFQGRQRIHGAEQSWAEMTINHRPIGLRLKVEVNVWHDGTHQGQYSHQTNFHHGQLIIRDLFDVFSTIQNRSLEVHSGMVGKDDLVTNVFSRARQREAVRGQWLFGTGCTDCITFNLSQCIPACNDDLTKSDSPAAAAPNHAAVEKQIAKLTARCVFSDRSSLKGNLVSSAVSETCRRGLQKLEHQAQRTSAEVVRGVRQLS